MQHVSEEYKESMKSPLRNRGYMRVVFGGTSSQAQNNVTISGDQLSYSDPSKVFNNGNDDYVYATLEQDFVKVDGSKYFYGYPRLETAFISDDFVDDGYQFTLTFDNPVSFDTMVFNFGDDYPLSFTITDNNGNTYGYVNDTGRIYEISQNYEGITELLITITQMKNQNTRFRLYSLRFSFGFEYQNDAILDSELDSSFSPICENLPQMNFSVKLINENHYFDPDNPKSILNQFDTSTEVNVYYGYQLTDHIEWLQAAKLFVENWDSNAESATIYARDILQTKDKEYTGGSYGNITLYNLAVAIFTAMGIDDYEIDDDLKNITTVNAFTKISCREALQIIANAACKKLFIRRDGTIKIGDDQYTLNYSSNGIMSYSNLNSITENNTKYEYATLEGNFVKANSADYFMPTSSYLNVGYVSQQMSNRYHLFKRSMDIGLTEDVLRNNIINLPYTLEESVTDTDNPMITITISGSTSIRGIRIIFGDTYATKFVVRCLDNDVIQEQVCISNNQKDLEVEFASGFGNKIEIEFVETVEPYNRVRVKYLQVLKDRSSISFDEIDIMSYPQFTKFNTIQTMIVPYYTYSGGQATEHDVVETISGKGDVIKWENPLVTTQTMAQNLLAWLKEYYLLDGCYKFNTRGNPEIDVNDSATQIKYNGELMEVLITDLTLGFDGAFSGSVRTLKKGEII